MSNWYSIMILMRKDVMIQSGSQDEAEQIAIDEFADMGIHAEANTEGCFEPGDRRVDRYIECADEVIRDE